MLLMKGTHLFDFVPKRRGSMFTPQDKKKIPAQDKNVNRSHSQENIAVLTNDLKEQNVARNDLLACFLNRATL